MTTKFFGAPGTGKTTKTISEFKKALREYNPNNIMYNTYRRNAAEDAKARISKEACVPIKELKSVKTTHGICLSLLNHYGYIDSGYDKKKSPIMNKSDYAQFNKECGYKINPDKVTVDDLFTSKNDPHLSFYGLMKSTRTPLHEMYANLMNDGRLTQPDAARFVKDFESWKAENHKIDFSDMVDIVLRYNMCPECPVQIYDEAQDMTTQLFDVAQMWSKEADQVFLAGDPLQTLYPFWGADPAHFMDWSGEMEVLPVSQRLSQNIWKIAGDIIDLRTPYHIPEIETRRNSGHISKIENEQLYGFLKSIPRNKDSTVFHLVRTSYTGYHVAKTLASLGIVFGGIPEYAWKYSEMRLCNAIKAIRSGSNLSNDELIAIVEYYKIENPINGWSGKKLDAIKDAIRDGKVSLQAKSIKQQIINTIMSKTPFSGCALRGFNLYKMQNALENQMPKLTSNDIQKTQILTIHGAKGMEADTVFLHNEITPSINRAMLTPKGVENEAYVWYVGVTRTRKNLFVVKYTGNSYPIPGVCA